MTRAFLSYSRQDEAAVVALEGDLKDFGVDVWIDKDLTGGQAWWDLILQRIRDCECFLFALSPDSLKSEACEREYNYAAALRKPILPLLMTDGVATKLLPRALSMIQFVDYRQHDKQAFIALTRSLGTLPNPGALPEPLPTPPDVPISYLSSLSERISTPQALNFDQQSALLVELKTGLRNPEDVEDVHQLLREFSKRGDLLATVAREIDELLGAAPTPIARATHSRPAESGPRRGSETRATTLQSGEAVNIDGAPQRITELVTNMQQDGVCWEVRADQDTRIVLAARGGRYEAQAHYGAYLDFKSSKLRGMGWQLDPEGVVSNIGTILVIAVTLGLALLNENTRARFRRRSVTRTWNLDGGAGKYFEIAQTIASSLQVLAPRVRQFTLAETTEENEAAWWESYLPRR